MSTRPTGPDGLPIGQARAPLASIARRPAVKAGGTSPAAIPLSHTGGGDALHAPIAIHTHSNTSQDPPPSGGPHKPAPKPAPKPKPKPHPKPKPKPHPKPKPKPRPAPKPTHKPAPKPSGVSHPTNSPANATPADNGGLFGGIDLFPILLLAGGALALWYLYTHRKGRG